MIVIYGSGQGIGSHYVNNTGELIKINNEIGMLWFLLALFWSFIFLRIVSNKKYMSIYIVGITLLGYFSSKIFWLPTSIQAGMNATIFLYLGYLIKKHQVIEKIMSLKFKRIYFVICLFIWSFFIINGEMLMYRNQYKLSFLEILGALAGIFCVFGISIFLENDKFKCLRVPLCKCGEFSLLVLSVHFLDVKLGNVTYVVANGILNIVNLNATIPVFVLTVLLQIIVYSVFVVFTININFTKNIFNIKH